MRRIWIASLILLTACSPAIQPFPNAQPAAAVATRSLDTSGTKCPLTAAEVAASTGYPFEAVDPSSASYVNCSFATQDMSLFMVYSPELGLPEARALLTGGTEPGTLFKGMLDGTCREETVSALGTFGLSCDGGANDEGSGPEADVLFAVDAGGSFRIFITGHHTGYEPTGYEPTTSACLDAAKAIFAKLMS